MAIARAVKIKVAPIGLTFLRQPAHNIRIEANLPLLTIILLGQS